MSVSPPTGDGGNGQRLRGLGECLQRVWDIHRWRHWRTGGSGRPRNWGWWGRVPRTHIRIVSILPSKEKRSLWIDRPTAFQSAGWVCPPRKYVLVMVGFWLILYFGFCFISRGWTWQNLSTWVSNCATLLPAGVRILWLGSVQCKMIKKQNSANKIQFLAVGWSLEPKLHNLFY